MGVGSVYGFINVLVLSCFGFKGFYFILYFIFVFDFKSFLEISLDFYIYYVNLLYILKINMVYIR